MSKKQTIKEMFRCFHEKKKKSPNIRITLVFLFPSDYISTNSRVGVWNANKLFIIEKASLINVLTRSCYAWILLMKGKMRKEVKRSFKVKNTFFEYWYFYFTVLKKHTASRLINLVLPYEIARYIRDLKIWFD